LNFPISIPAYADENQGLDLGQAQHFDGVKPVSGIPTIFDKKMSIYLTKL
jgi:hypothetical protein